MPWTPKDAYKHNKAANTPGAQAQWAAVANSVLNKTGDEAQAIREANAAISKRKPPTRPSKPGTPTTESLAPGMEGPQPLSGEE
jgi:hypothetical protein